MSPIPVPHRSAAAMTEPALVPTIRSASPTGQGRRSCKAGRAPAIHAAPSTPPAPNTSPTRVRFFRITDHPRTSRYIPAGVTARSSGCDRLADPKAAAAADERMTLHVLDRRVEAVRLDHCVAIRTIAWCAIGDAIAGDDLR